MLKRLVIGLIKGMVIGALVGVGVQFGLPELGYVWSIPSGSLAGYLLTMGAAGTAGVFAGRPPWQEGAWLEALLKGLVGVALGAAGYWASATYVPVTLPFPGVPGGAPWTALPALFLPALASVYGALVELDNTGSSTPPAKKSGRGGPKARVAVDLDDDLAHGDTVHAEHTRPARRRA